MKEHHVYELLAILWFILACLLPKRALFLRTFCLSLGVLSLGCWAILVIEGLVARLSN